MLKNGNFKSLLKVVNRKRVWAIEDLMKMFSLDEDETIILMRCCLYKYDDLNKIFISEFQEKRN
ncbi:hypothetical protein SDC9_208302 [bioreactor metagenome]|uniref:Uncharacterized protein n=1 Tax=bioreactor metagenome TaxID=1076179 RepID=A0A645JLR4_9ZZZZ